MEALYPILLIAGRFVLATGLLMLLYWSVWRKQGTYRAKRAYLLTMPAMAMAIALLQVEVYKPEPVVVEVIKHVSQTANESTAYSPLTNLIKEEGVKSGEPLIASPEAKNKHTESAAYTAGSATSLPSPEEDKEWGLPLLGLAYTLIIIVLFTPFAVSLYQVRRLRREVSVRKDDCEHSIHILMGSVVKVPFSFHRTIFMPLCLTEAQRRMITEHERAHILHRHYIDVWVSETVTRLMWWNPFLWWARAELRNVHEFEADSEVLATGEDVLAYQTILIEEVLHGDVIIANGFNHSFIRRRFIEMLQTTNRRMTTWAKAGTAAWILLTVALMCCTVGEAETVYRTVTCDKLQATDEGARPSHSNKTESGQSPTDGLMHPPTHVKDTTKVQSPAEETQPDTTEITSADSVQWVKGTSVSPNEYLPEVLSQLGNLNAESLQQLLTTMVSLQEISPEVYAQLKETFPNKNLPSMDSINNNVRAIRKSMETIMLEGLTGLQTGLQQMMNTMLKDTGLATISLNNMTVPPKVAFTVPKNTTELPAEDASERNSNEEFISPQWELKLPEGYVRLTDYRKWAETNAKAKEQYDLLVKCIQKAKNIRNEALKQAYRKKHARYTTVQEEVKDDINNVFSNANIEMQKLGAYRLPDSTIVIEDDQQNLVPQSVNIHNGTTKRDPRLHNAAPTMERDKSPNYDAHNEQTWPVYTHVQTINREEYNKQPQVFRGKDCTYVVEHFPITYDFHWFYTNTQDKLVDTKTGDQYMKRYTEHFHMNNYLWIHGMKGKVIRIISVFPPLPKNVTSVDFILSHIPDEIRLSNAAHRKDYKKLKVQELEPMNKVVY